MLVVDQSIKAHSDYMDKNFGAKEEVKKLDNVRKILNYVIIGLVVVGFFSYMFRQMAEFGPDFNLTKFLFSYECKHLSDPASTVINVVKNAVSKNK